MRPANRLGDVKRAVRLARDAHKGQVRKGWPRDPFINHPRRVCKAYLRYRHKTTAGMIAALCHDVVEDTPLALEDIGDVFGGEVERLVEDLTKPGEISTREYLVRLPSWPLESRKLKLCDLEDNILSARTVTEEQRRRMWAKWEMMLDSLLVNVPLRGEMAQEFFDKWNEVHSLLVREKRSLDQAG